jgi:hypothetical protein
MKIYPIDPLHDPRWERFTETHPLATIFHSRPWLQALNRTYGYETLALTASAPKDAITNAVVFCRVSSWLTGHRLVSLPFSDHCDVLASNLNTQSDLLSAMIERLRQSGARYVEIRPSGPAPGSPGSSELGSGFRDSREFFLHKLDLRPPVEEIFRRCQKDSVQRKIRRAEREGIRVEAGRGQGLLASFRRLLSMTRQRHGFPPPPRRWFQNLIDCMGDRLTIRVAHKGEEPIAGILTLSFRDTLVYKYGGSDPRFHATGAMHALLWSAIQNAKQAGIQQLDLGRSDIDQQGLITFKDRWGAVRTKIQYLRHSAKPSRMTEPPAWSSRPLRPFIERMPRAMLGVAGRLLYRHVG